MNNINKFQWKIGGIWKGCVIASIAHAIMVAHYPEIDNEHSWDGINYNVQDSSGARGTITFQTNYYIGAFRDDRSERLALGPTFRNAIDYFNGASQQMIELAKQETLQYLLDEVDDKIMPLITTAFWGTENDTFSNDTFEEMFCNGGFLIQRQTMESESSIEEWKKYYDMSKQQCDLLRSIYKQKVDQPNHILILSKNKIAMIGTDDEEGLNESKISFSEIGIEWEK